MYSLTQNRTQNTRDLTCLEVILTLAPYNGVVFAKVARPRRVLPAPIDEHTL